MEYNKPQIVKLDEAVRAIQSGVKQGPESDAATHPTGCAYEADE
jgi:hypothetical protein